MTTTRTLNRIGLAVNVVAAVGGAVGVFAFLSLGMPLLALAVAVAAVVGVLVD